MKKRLATLILFIIASIFCFVNFHISRSYAEENEDAFLAILALNYCHMSLFKITEYNDRVVLDEEYNNIINNINLSKIKDPELIGILKKLMDVLTEFKLDERSKEKLFRVYERNVEGALYNSMGNALEGGADKSIATANVMKNLAKQSAIPDSSNVIKDIATKAATTAAAGSAVGTATGPGAPVVAAAVCAVVLVQAGSAYMDYRNAIKEYRNVLDETVWKLETNAIARINDINKTFLETYWKLMTKHNAPDKWRLTLEQFKDYFSIVKDEDDGRKYRNLVRMEGDLGLFPPYWYFRGAAAQKIGKKDDVLKCFAMYEKVRKGFFRQDKTYSSAVMLKVVETDYQDNPDLLSADLNEVITQDRKDWRKRLFCAYKFIEYGDLDKAKQQVQANLDAHRAVAVSRKALGDIYYLENDKKHLEQLIDKTISDDKATNQEVLYLIGKLPAERMVEKIREPIVGINGEIDTHLLGKDDFILHVPQKWILDDPENLSMKLTLGDKEFTPKDKKANKEQKEIIFTFEDALDVKELLQGQSSLPMAFSFNTQTGRVDFFAEIGPKTVLVEKGYTDKGVDLAKSATGKLLKYVGKDEKKQPKKADVENQDDKEIKDKKEEKILEFDLKKITYLDTCFVISKDNQITKCPSQEILTVN